MKKPPTSDKLQASVIHPVPGGNIAQMFEHLHGRKGEPVGTKGCKLDIETALIRDGDDYALCARLGSAIVILQRLPAYDRLVSSAMGYFVDFGPAPNEAHNAKWKQHAITEQHQRMLNNIAGQYKDTAIPRYVDWCRSTGIATMEGLVLNGEDQTQAIQEAIEKEQTAEEIAEQERLAWIAAEDARREKAWDKYAKQCDDRGLVATDEDFERNYAY